MHNYDMLRNTWIYQEIEEQIRAAEGRRYQKEQRQMLLEIVQARFPRIRFLVRQLAEQITDQAMLRELVVKIGSTPGEKQARQIIREIKGTLKNEDSSEKDDALAAETCYNENQ